MEEELAVVLKSFGLSSFETALLDLGAKNKADLLHLEENDLVQIGLKVVEARKLLRADAPCASKSNPASPTSGGASSDDVGAALHPGLQRYHSRNRRRGSAFWQEQFKRPKRLIFIRHGESEANIDRKITETVPDHALHLTATGRKQALNAGQRLRDLVGEESVRFTVSPYTRTRETLNGILRAWGDKGEETVTIRQDVRIREQEYGNYDSPDMKNLHREKKQFGSFYYRFPNGESPADCYDRASGFMETLYRSWADNEHENHAIVCHGMMILVILMRFVKTDIDEFENYESLANCEFVVLERPDDDAKYSISFTWAEGEEKKHGGLRKKTLTDKPAHEIWNGDPEADLLTSPKNCR